jgi:hypothetical protein
VLEVNGDTQRMDVSTALRDLADVIDEGSEGHTVVCVIGRGEAAKIYALGGDLPNLLARTANCLEGVVASILTGKRSH